VETKCKTSKNKGLSKYTVKIFSGYSWNKGLKKRKYLRRVV
jgi:hypothetical protein